MALCVNHRSTFRLGKSGQAWDLAAMSLAELKNESAALRPEEQRELAAFLAVIRMRQSGEWDEATAEQNRPGHQGWISLDEAKRQLNPNSEVGSLIQS
jgi:hypothetical protein